MSFSEDIDFAELNPLSPELEIEPDPEQGSSTLSKKSGRKKKLVWDYFEVSGVYKSGHTGAKCLYCLKTWKNAKAMDLEDHIATQCKKVPAEIKTTFLRILTQRIRDTNNNTTSQSDIQTTTTTTTATTSNSNKKCRIQSSVTTFYEPLTIDSAKEIRCTRALTKFFVCCGIPFSIVEHPFFIDFIKSLCPAYNPPNRHYLSTTLINSELAHIQIDIEEDLINEKNLTLGK